MDPSNLEKQESIKAWVTGNPSEKMNTDPMKYCVINTSLLSPVPPHGVNAKKPNTNAASPPNRAVSSEVRLHNGLCRKRTTRPTAFSRC